MTSLTRFTNTPWWDLWLEGSDFKNTIFFKLKKQNSSKNHSKWVRCEVPNISSFGAQVKGANNQVLTPRKYHHRTPKCFMHNTYILHQTSYHLLVQVPSCATQRKNRDLKKVRGGVTVTHTTFPLLPKRSVSKGGVERIKMRGAVTEMSLYQNCNSVRNTNFQISDEQWFLEGKNKRLTCAQ